MVIYRLFITAVCTTRDCSFYAQIVLDDIALEAVRCNVEGLDGVKRKAFCQTSNFQLRNSTILTDGSDLINNEQEGRGTYFNFCGM